MKQYLFLVLATTLTAWSLVALPQASAQNPVMEVSAAPKVYRPVGDFSFTDDTGAEVSRESMLGTIWIAQFFLINCKGPCPVVTTRLANTMRKLRGELKVQAVSITVDPEHDTPQRLTAYKEVLNIEPDRWHFVRGERATLGTVLSKSFHVPDSNDPQAHTTNLVLIDPRGQIRGYYSGLRTEDFSRLDKDVYFLLTERVPETQNQ